MAAAAPTPLTGAPLQVWIERIDTVLPQTQCTRCGYADCRAYAAAMAQGQAQINRCPPGGAEGIARLAALTGSAALELDAGRGREGPRALAVIDEAWCIGCTLCIQACPVDCIVGASRLMHTVIDGQCTGCDLCAPACPVDCIAMVPVTGTRTGWQAWSADQARTARDRYIARNQRQARFQREQDEMLAAKATGKLAALQAGNLAADPRALARKQTTIDAALARARAPRHAHAKPDDGN